MKIELCAWKPADIHALARHANNKHVWNTLRNSFPHPYTIKDAQQWVAIHQHASPVTHFAIHADGNLAGGTGLSLKEDIYRKTAEIGYWIAEPFWGKGIATVAVDLLVGYTLSNFDVIRLYAEVFANNPASMKVLQKNGFHLECVCRKAIFKNDQLFDAQIWVKFRPGI